MMVANALQIPNVDQIFVTMVTVPLTAQPKLSMESLIHIAIAPKI